MFPLKLKPYFTKQESFTCSRTLYYCKDPQHFSDWIDQSRHHCLQHYHNHLHHHNHYLSNYNQMHTWCWWRTTWKMTMFSYSSTTGIWTPLPYSTSFNCDALHKLLPLYVDMVRNKWQQCYTVHFSHTLVLLASSNIMFITCEILFWFPINKWVQNITRIKYHCNNYIKVL